MNTIQIVSLLTVGMRFWRSRLGPQIAPYAALHSLTFQLNEVDWLELAKDPHAGSLRVSAKDARCTINVIAPDFTNVNVPPSALGALQYSLRGRLNGTAILGRRAPAADAHRVLLGTLQVDRLAGNDVAILGDFWPTSAVQPDWIYLLTSLGIGLTADSGLGGAPDTLLLPQFTRRPRDFAYTQESSVVEWWYKPVADPAVYDPLRANAREFLSLRFGQNSPDYAPWPSGNASVGRRWRVLDLGSRGAVDRSFDAIPSDDQLVLQRSTADTGQIEAAAPQLEASPDVAEPAVKAELWEVSEMNKRKRVYRGAVVTLLQERIRAKVRWPDGLTASVFDAALSHGAFAAVQNGERLKRVHCTLATRQTLGKTPIRVTRGLNGPPVTTIPPSWMAFAAVTLDAGGLESSRTSIPRWLQIQEGWIDFGRLADKNHAQKVQELLEASTSGITSLSGGVPLGLLGGPPGLEAMAVEASEAGAGSGVRLRIRDDAGGELPQIELAVSDAVLLWRTPAWWVVDTTTTDEQEKSPRKLPDLASVFAERFTRIDMGMAQEADLAEALGRVFRSTLWIGFSGEVGRDDWTLASSAGETLLTIPPLFAQKALAWVGPKDASLLQITGEVGAAPSALFLEGSRGLVHLHSPTGAVALRISAHALPCFRSHPLPSVELPPMGWVASDQELFHPNVTGLGYLPVKQRFVYRHGPPMLVDGWLRQQGETGAEAQVTDSSLNSVRLRDDVALWHGETGHPAKNGWFTTSSGIANEALWARGWLPSGDVSVQHLQLANLAYQKGDPSMTLHVAVGEKADQHEVVTISPHANGFDKPMSIGTTSGSTWWLQQGESLPFVGFGQSLATLDRDTIFVDGNDRRWQIFDGSARQVREGGTKGNLRNLLSIGAVSDLSADGLTGWPIGVFLLDVPATKTPPRDEAAFPVWELTGGLDDDGRPMAPVIGPFAVLPVSLGAADVNDIEAIVRIGPPYVDRSVAGAAAAGQLGLHWHRPDGGDWRIEGCPQGSFDWTISGPTDVRFLAKTAQSHVSIRRLVGNAVVKHGKLDLVLTNVVIATPLGDLRFATKDAVFEVVRDGDRDLVRVKVETVSPAGSDFLCRFSVRCELSEADVVRWLIEDSEESRAILRWKGSLGELAVRFNDSMLGAVQVADLKLHPAAPVVNFNGQVFRSSYESWGLVATPAQDTRTEALIVRLRVVSGRDAPVLHWTVRASAVLISAKVFGKSFDDANVRADLRWICDGPLEPENRRFVQSSITGQVLFLNDFVFDRGGKPGFEVVHTFWILFDRLLLTDQGTLPEQIEVAAEHTIGLYPNHIHFSSAHRLFIRYKDEIPYLEGSSVLVLAASDELDAVRLSAQVWVYGERTIAVGQSSLGRGAVQGMVVRMPIRTSNQRIVVKVPTPGTDAKMRWLHRRVSESALDDPDPGMEIWHRRGALAGLISPALLHGLLKDQVAASFNGVSLPVAGDVLDDWSTLFQGHTTEFHCGFVDSGASTSGALALPYAVGIKHELPNPVKTSADPASIGWSVELVCIEPEGARGSLSSVASGLVTAGRPDSPDLAKWARQEIRRRGMTGAAVLVVRALPKRTTPIGRTFEIAAVSSNNTAPAMRPPVVRPAVSALADANTRVESTGWGPRMLVAADLPQVLEALRSMPLQSGPESARVTRLATAALWNDHPWASISAKGGMAVAQQVQFSLSERAPVYEVVRSPIYHIHPNFASNDLGTVVTAPIADCVLWSVRPGDTASTTVGSAFGDALRGPTVKLNFRSPRGLGDLALKSLALTCLRARWSGVDRCLYNVTSAEAAGFLRTEEPDQMLLSVVSARETVHFDFPTQMPGPELILGKREDVVVVHPDGRVVGRMSFDEPILSGIFRNSGMPGEVLALAVVHLREKIAVIPPDRTVVLDDLMRNPQNWNERQDQVDLVIFRLLSRDQVTSDPDAADAAYDPGFGRNLERLLRITDIDSKKALPWIASNQSTQRPAVAVVKPLGANAEHGWEVVAALPIVWIDTTLTDQPHRVLVVAGGRVVGYGNASGRTIVRRQASEFVRVQHQFALDSGATAPGTRVCAWRFAPTGAHIGRAEIIIS